MSRSYRHTPIIGDENDQFFKRAFNHRIRKIKDIPNGNAYRKLNCSYAIADYKFYQSKKNMEKFFNSDEELEDWWLRKVYYR